MIPAIPVVAIWLLAFFGSLIGFYAYFTVLQKLSASNVTLITLITPVIALTLGAVLNGEVVNDKLILGAFMVLLGLSIYHFMPFQLRIGVDQNRKLKP